MSVQSKALQQAMLTFTNAQGEVLRLKQNLINSAFAKQLYDGNDIQPMTETARALESHLKYFMGYPIDLSNPQGLMVYRATMATKLFHGDVNFTRVYILNKYLKVPKMDIVCKMFYIFYEVIAESVVLKESPLEVKYKDIEGPINIVCFQVFRSTLADSGYEDWLTLVEDEDEVQTAIARLLWREADPWSQIDEYMQMTMDELRAFTTQNETMQRAQESLNQYRDTMGINLFTCVNNASITVKDDSQVTNFQVNQSCVQQQIVSDEQPSAAQ